MSVLVVGATGSLGTEICRRLADRKTPPRALVRETSDPARVEEQRELGAEIVVGDLRDRDSLDRACAGADVVLSTATSIIREGEISAVDGKGHLLIADRDNDRVVVLDEKNRSVVGTMTVEKPENVAVDPKSGGVYVTRWTGPGSLASKVVTYSMPVLPTR